MTGNLEPVARLKLERAGLGRFFAPGQGGFASDHASRAELPAIARRRAGGWPRERTVVIGLPRGGGRLRRDHARHDRLDRRARERHRRRAVRRGGRPHRRDRPDRPPHRRRRLPVVHRRRRLGPGDPRRPARRDLHPRRARDRRGRQEADPPAQGRGAQEGAGAQGPAHRHRRQGRRRRALDGARRRRGGDRRRAGRVPPQPRDLALDGQPARLLRGVRGRAAGRRGGRRAGRRGRPAP